MISDPVFERRIVPGRPEHKLLGCGDDRKPDAVVPGATEEPLGDGTKGFEDGFGNCCHGWFLKTRKAATGQERFLAATAG